MIIIITSAIKINSSNKLTYVDHCVAKKLFILSHTVFFKFVKLKFRKLT
jgi:hypothetical protein